MIQNAITTAVKFAVMLAIGLSILAVLILCAGRTWYWVSGVSQTQGIAGTVQVWNWPATLSGPGGYSGLALQENGTVLRAASDHGFLMEAQIVRDETSRLVTLNAPKFSQVLSDQAKTLTGWLSDLEGLTPLPNGDLGLAYEGIPRIMRLSQPPDHGERIPTPLHKPDRFKAHTGNSSFEAIATLPSGDLLAILEGKPSPRQAHAYLYSDGEWQGPHFIPARPNWDITGADIGPDGCLYLVERQYGVLTGFQTQLVRLRGRLAPPFELTQEVIWRGAPLRFGNGEGLSIWSNAAGKDTATIITDDGFPPAPLGHPTQLIELPLKKAPAC
ncbi:MAG: esterase-like activity of phytase family protein [Litoreibacter sp.]